MKRLINAFGTEIKAVVKPKNKEHQQELQNQKAYKRKEEAHKKIEGDIKNGTHKGEEDGAAIEELLNSYLEPEAEEVFKNDTNKGEVREEELKLKHDFDSHVDKPFLDIIKKDEEYKRKDYLADLDKSSQLNFDDFNSSAQSNAFNSGESLPDVYSEKSLNKQSNALNSGKPLPYIQPKGYENSSNKGQHR